MVTDRVWAIGLMLIVAALIALGVSNAFAASTIPGVVRCADTKPWTIVEYWLPPPPNANQGPVPAPETRITSCFQQGDDVILEAFGP